MFAMLASYVLSRTLVPTLAHVPAQAAKITARRYATIRSRAFRAAFERGFERLRARLSALADAPWLNGVRCLSRLSAAHACCAFLLVPFLGQDFFPAPTAVEFILHVRAKTGTRIEETARLCDLVENSIRSEIPAMKSATSSTTSACPTAP